MSRHHEDPSEIRGGSMGPLFAPVAGAEPEPGRPVPTGPLYSNGDKRTSAIAAGELKADPERLAGLQRDAFNLVREFPGRTCMELANICHLRRGEAAQGIEWYRQRIGRRLSELEDADLVHSGESRRDPATGRLAVTWWPGPRPKGAGT